MTCKELAEKLLETPDMPVSVFAAGNSVGCRDIKIGKRLLWCNGKQEEYRVIRVTSWIRNDIITYENDESVDSKR